MFNKKYRDSSIRRLEQKEEEYNSVNKKMLEEADSLYILRSEFKGIIDKSWSFLNSLRNKPTELDSKLSTIKIEKNRFKDLENLIAKEAKKIDLKAKAGVAAGVALGTSLATLGPTAAMGVAMTFGTASTGAAIGSLSGAAATNAALAWLGGGSLAAGGGGMVAGNAFLALAGPLGWGIGGVGLLGAGIFNNKKNKEISLEVNKQSFELEKHIKINSGLIEEINLIKKEINESHKELENYMSLLGEEKNFNLMTDNQKYNIACLVNNTQAGVKLLNKAIGGE